MVCIYCGGKTNIVNSRLLKKSGQKWRRHKCSRCHALFTSLENYQLGSCLFVQSVSKGLRPFSRDKLFLSIYEVVNNLKHGLAIANELTQTVINNLTINKPLTPVINTSDISYSVLEVLKHYNAAAAVHYASMRQAMPLANDVKRLLKDI